MKRKRPRFVSREVTLMNCIAANLDHDDGEPATVITVAHRDEIEPLVIDLKDSRMLVVRLLMSLHTAEDGFATALLTEKFPLDEGGTPRWPESS